MARPAGTGKGTSSTGFRLTSVAAHLWKTLSDREGLNKTAYFEMVIRRLAREQGIDPEKVSLPPINK